MRVTRALSRFGLFCAALSAQMSFGFDTGYRPDPGQASQSVIDAKIAIHLNVLPTEKQLGPLKNAMTNMRKRDHPAEVRVVVHGSAIELFELKKQTPQIRSFLDDLRSIGVRFLICNNGLINHKLKLKDLYKVENQDVVPSALIELVRLQREGFAYIRLL